MKTPPYFSLASSSAIDCCDGPLGVAGLIDSEAARRCSFSLLYSSGVQNRPIHRGPIQRPYLVFLSDPGDEFVLWFWLCGDCRALSMHSFKAIFEGFRPAEYKCMIWQRMREITLAEAMAEKALTQMNK